jgi:CBS domain-containing protein
MQLNEKIHSVLERKGRLLLSVAPETSVFDALRAMADKDVGALAVIGEEGLCGIISERDYARKVILLGKTSRETCVADVMSSPAATVSPGDTIDDCLRTMTDYRLRHLIVVEGGRPVGIVSIGDLVNWIISAQGEMIGQLHSYIAGNYPG